MNKVQKKQIKKSQKFQNSKEKKEEEININDKENDDNEDGDISRKNTKKGRMIIRNLIFDVQKKHLIQLFKKYGTIEDVNIPKNLNNNMGKGFAFVQFPNKNQALKAIKELNGTVFKGRKIILDLSVDKRKYDAQQSSHKEMEEEHNKEQEAHDESSSEDESDDDEESDNENEIIKQKKEIKQDKPIVEKKNEQDSQKQQKQKQEDYDYSVFVQNIPYEATEKELLQFFKNFGEIQQCKIVKDRETGESKGTGFVKFKKREDAAKTLALNEKQRNQKKNYSKKQADSFVNFELKGKFLNILKCESRDARQKQLEKKGKEEQTKQETKNTSLKSISKLKDFIKMDKASKRNIQLLEHGTGQIKSWMTEEAKEKRQEHFQSLVGKLKNPNMHVDANRIYFSKLPKVNFDEDNIRSIINDYFNKQYSQKKLKTLKIIKEIKLLKEQATNKSKGIGFAQFDQSKFAIEFMKYIEKQGNITKYFKENRIPIIEFGFIDSRIKQKIDFQKNKIKEKKQEQKKEKQEITDEERKKISEKFKNQNTANKTLILNLIDEAKVENIPKIKALLKDINSRGNKQRLMKKAIAAFGEQAYYGGNKPKPPQKPKKEIEYIKQGHQKTMPANNLKNKMAKQNQQAMMNQDIKKIKNQFKQKNKNKSKALNRQDELDVMANKYKDKLNKKIKWNK